MRDYLYVPLGGNRGSELATQRNLLLTMLIGGLWHGASWMFVLWGGLHGLYLVIERALRGWLDGRWTLRRDGLAEGVLTLGTFLVVALTWIPFRAPDWTVFSQVVSGLFRWEVSMQLEPIVALLSFVAMAATVYGHFTLRDRSLEAEFGQWGTVAQTAAVAVCLVGIFLCSGGDERAFIYFQF